MSAEQEKWDDTAFAMVDSGITYVDADAVRRWLERLDPALAKKWDANVDHIVRTGVEQKQREHRWWRPW